MWFQTEKGCKPRSNRRDGRCGSRQRKVVSLEAIDEMADVVPDRGKVVSLEAIDEMADVVPDRGRWRAIVSALYDTFVGRG